MNIDQLSGHDFEDLVEKLIREMGFVTEETRRTADGGIDIRAINEQPILKGLYIIQCKRHSKPIGEPVLRDLYGVVTSERANKGILITNSVFSKAAERFADKKPIELIDGARLAELFDKYLDKHFAANTEHLIVPEEFKLSFDHLENEARRIRNRWQVIRDKRVFLDPKLYKNNKTFISYCEGKAVKVETLREVFNNQVSHFTTLFRSNISETQADYTNTQEVKNHCRELVSTVDSIEKELEDVLATHPPGTLTTLHSALLDMYARPLACFFGLVDSLSKIMNSIESLINKGDVGREGPEKIELEMVLPLALGDEEAKTFVRELKKARRER